MLGDKKQKEGRRGEVGRARSQGTTNQTLATSSFDQTSSERVSFSILIISQ